GEWAPPGIPADDAIAPVVRDDVLGDGQVCETQGDPGRDPLTPKAVAGDGVVRYLAGTMNIVEPEPKAGVVSNLAVRERKTARAPDVDAAPGVVGDDALFHDQSALVAHQPVAAITRDRRVGDQSLDVRQVEPGREAGDRAVLDLDPHKVWVAAPPVDS